MPSRNCASASGQRRRSRSARHRQPNVGGRLRAGGQLRVGLRHLVGPPAQLATRMRSWMARGRRPDPGRAAWPAPVGGRRRARAGSGRRSRRRPGRARDRAGEPGRRRRPRSRSAGGRRAQRRWRAGRAALLCSADGKCLPFSFFSYIRNTSAVATYGVHVRASQRRPAAAGQRAAQACASGMAESARARAASAGVGSEQWIS